VVVTMSDRLSLEKIITQAGAEFVGTADNTVTIKDPFTERKLCMFADGLRTVADVRRALRERRMMQSGDIAANRRVSETTMNPACAA
jgi:hypothetical protein